MKRADARELAFKTIYSKFFNHEEDDELFNNADQKGLEFTKNISGLQFAFFFRKTKLGMEWYYGSQNQEAEV